MENKEFVDKDHINVYKVYRRDIPPKLLDIILDFVREKITGELQTAVDVGCGSGQSTVILSPYFDRVIGTDISRAQINAANEVRSANNVEYYHQISEKIDLPDNSVQLITASSCLHWFDREVFFPESRRVLAKNGVLATYVYPSLKPFVEDESKMKQIDELIDELYTTHLGEYWSPKSKIAFNLYRDLEFPFEEVKRIYNILDIFDGTLADILGYLQTMSGFNKFKTEVGEEAASKLVNYYSSRLRNILEVEGDPEKINLKLCRNFVLVLCRKSSA